MAHEFSGSAVIDRPINLVFAFLSGGTNDRRFSPRVQEIQQTTPGPIGVGTVFESKVKDAGMTTSRKFELSTYEAPTKIRWTKVTVHNEFEGHGLGKLIVGFAFRAAAKDAPAFGQRIKTAVEAG